MMSETWKKWFPLWKHILAVAVLAFFLVLIVWNKRSFTGYFPEWLSRRMGSHVWACVVAVALAYWGKWAVASGLTLGWVGGVPVAQVIGDQLYAYHQTVYTAEELIRVGHKHAYIWWMSIAVGVLLGVLVQTAVWLYRRRQTK